VSVTDFSAIVLTLAALIEPQETANDL